MEIFEYFTDILIFLDIFPSIFRYLEYFWLLNLKITNILDNLIIFWIFLDNRNISIRFEFGFDYFCSKIYDPFEYLTISVRIRVQFFLLRFWFGSFGSVIMPIHRTEDERRRSSIGFFQFSPLMKWKRTLEVLFVV